MQASWFKRHPWLTLCTTRQKLFCFYCSAAARKNLLVFSKNQDSAFISNGYCNWRKSSKAFLKHGYSSTHAEAVLKINSTQDIGSQLDYIHKEEQKARRESLLKQLSSLLFLLHQGLAIRGHNMEDGNLFQLLKLRSQDDPQLITWLNDHNYYSPDILSEQIELMAHSILRGVLKEINSAGWFSILADEATDVKRCEQMCVCIRWVDDDYNVNEETIGLVKVSKTDSATLFAALHDVCIRCVLPLEKCRGQAYDVAANMSGHISGVAARVQKEEKAALHVHCLAHSLNLCLQSTARVCMPISECLHLVMELVQLIKWSPKRSYLFQQIKNEMSPESQDLKPLCPTRWTVRTEAINAVLTNYATLTQVLDEVSSSGRDEYAMKSHGYLQLMDKFSTYFGLKLGYLVFSVTEQLSCTLQGKDTTAQEAIEAAKITECYLRKLRSDQEFNQFFEKVTKSSQDLTSEPVLPRKRKIPKRVDEGSDPHQYHSPKDYFRHQYFLALDEVANELS